LMHTINKVQAHRAQDEIRTCSSSSTSGSHTHTTIVQLLNFVGQESGVYIGLQATGIAFDAEQYANL
jgi:hypothetical protein